MNEAKRAQIVVRCNLIADLYLSILHRWKCGYAPAITNPIRQSHFWEADSRLHVL
jgi:hypothetical protein